MLQVIPLDPSSLSEPALIRIVAATVNTPWGDLASTAVTIREGIRVLLQDSDAISPVLLVKMIPETVPIPRVPRESGQGEGALRRDFWESDIIYLGQVLHMTDRQPVPVYCRIFPMHPSTMCRHGPSSQLNASLRAWDPSP